MLIFGRLTLRLFGGDNDEIDTTRSPHGLREAADQSILQQKDGRGVCRLTQASYFRLAEQNTEAMITVMSNSKRRIRSKGSCLGRESRQNVATRK